MNRKHALITCAAIVAIAGGGYAFGRWSLPEPSAIAHADQDADATSVAEKRDDPQQSLAAGVSAPVVTGGVLPLSTMPLKDTFALLQARTNAGDAGAARRLVRDLDRCSRLRGTNWKNSGTTNDLVNRDTDGMSPAQLRTYQVLLDAMELRQQEARKDRQLCSGVSDETLDTLVANIAQAARLGDEDARACYLGRGPLYDARSLLAHPESLQAYRNNTSAMIGAGLAAGDWRVVDLLQQAYEPGAQSLLAGLVGADPVQHYRYLRLYRLGAEQHRIARLDQQLAAAAANLTPAQLAEADEWARTSLRGNFKGNSTSATPQGWEACAF
jgi:hypothetical protein